MTIDDIFDAEIVAAYRAWRAHFDFCIKYNFPTYDDKYMDLIAKVDYYCQIINGKASTGVVLPYPLAGG